MDETHLFLIYVLSLFSLIYLFKLVIHKKTKVVFVFFQKELPASSVCTVQTREDV
ncbi:hypothetical protein Hanom_Chr02g00103941 [Helianthus anomalus]